MSRVVARGSAVVSVMIALLVSALAGCREGTASSPATGTSASAIVDGDPVDPAQVRFPAVGAVLQSRTDVLGTGTCTGTLLCPTAVLTAAHCFDEATPASRFWFSTQEDLRDVYKELRTSNASAEAVCDLATGPCSAVKERWIHPKYRPPATFGMRTRQYDLAVVQLASPMVLPTYPRLASAEPSTCDDLVSVGYGLTQKEDSGSGGQMHQGLLRYTGQNRTRTNRVFGYYGTLTFTPGALATAGKQPRVAFGDSGGPVMDTAALATESGVLVLLDAAIFGVANNEIDGKSYYAPVHVERAEIAAAAASYCGVP